jgi:hypothetical protein
MHCCMHKVCICCLPAQGRDAIHHFAKHGLVATPKLVHCLQALAATDRAPSSPGTAQQETADADRDRHGPYDLTVVPRAQLPASYYTLTATGVVEVWPQAELHIHLIQQQLTFSMRCIHCSTAVAVAAERLCNGWVG